MPVNTKCWENGKILCPMPFLPPSTHLEYRFGYVLVHVFIHIALYLYFYSFFPNLFPDDDVFNARILADCLMFWLAAVVVAKMVRTTNWPLAFWWPRALNYTLVTRVGVLFFVLFIAQFLRVDFCVLLLDFLIFGFGFWLRISRLDC